MKLYDLTAIVITDNGRFEVVATVQDSTSAGAKVKIHNAVNSQFGRDWRWDGEAWPVLSQCVSPGACLFNFRICKEEAV